MKELKDIIHAAPSLWKVIFVVCFLSSLALMAASFCLPPQGVIDPSVLKGVGELLAFPTLLATYECIMKGIGVKYSKGDTTIEVGKKGDL